MQKSEMKTWFVTMAIVVPFFLVLAVSPTTYPIVVVVKRVGLAILALSVLYRAYASLQQRSRRNAAAKDA